MPSPVTYTLADIDGDLHIKCEMTDRSRPVWIANFWPTGQRTRHLLATFDLAPELLETLTVTNRYPGEYYIPNPNQWGVHGVALTLAQGGRTRSVRTEERPYPPPKTRCPVEYRSGVWYKRTARGDVAV